MSRRIAGLALDGRHDIAATDWDEEGLGPVRLLHGGTLSDIIITNDNRRIAGPQAALAPHGRGNGWGSIGSPGKRRPLSAALDNYGKAAHAADIAAAIDALARGADEVVLAVPDLPIFDEAAQGAMIAAARTSSARRVRLLWRPVAAMLSLINDGKLGKAHLGQQYRFLIHGAHGIEDQMLTLREDPGNIGHIAPQRNGPGRLWGPDVGLDALFERAAHHVRACNPIAWDRFEPSRLGPKLVVGTAQPAEHEVLRNNFDWWHIVTAPKLSSDYLLAEVDIAPEPDALCAGTFLITPLAAPFSADLANLLGSDIKVEAPELVARGCLHAGRLIERGLPHYFDRLEAISIAVLRDRDPTFVPLIPEGHLVAANREYVSEDLTDFVWPRNKVETEFYILKGKSEVREWTVQKTSAPPIDVPVRMRIRQTPGQSWAVLDITATEWDLLARAPEKLDWEGLTPTDKTPEEILEALRIPPPTIPERIVELAHVDLWMGSDWAGNNRAAQLAIEATQDGQVDASAWANLLSAQQTDPSNGVRYRRVTTDGELPEGLPNVVHLGFDKAISKLSDRLLNGASLQDNSPLRALTWSFSACPEAVQDALLDALEAHAHGNAHRLLRPAKAMTVLRQGSGRAITGEQRLRRLFTLLADGSLNNDTINALAMAVTRREEAPRALTRAQIDHFLHQLSTELITQVREQNFQIKFKNTLSAIAGMFRWREIEPYALLAAEESVAAELQRTLQETSQMLMDPQWLQVPARVQKITLLEKISEYLVGRGDPAILRIIDDST